MKSFFAAVLWRLGIGLAIALIGVIAAVAASNWKIDFVWFQGLGILCFVLAVLPHLQWPRKGYGGRGSLGFNVPPQTMANTQLRQSIRSRKPSNRKEFTSAISVTISLLLIGGVNIVVPYVVRHFVG